MIPFDLYVIPRSVLSSQGFTFIASFPFLAYVRFSIRFSSPVPLFFHLLSRCFFLSYLHIFQLPVLDF